jgi:hypothetical protein
MKNAIQISDYNGSVWEFTSIWKGWSERPVGHLNLFTTLPPLPWIRLGPACWGELLWVSVNSSGVDKTEGSRRHLGGEGAHLFLHSHTKSLSSGPSAMPWSPLLSSLEGGLEIKAHLWENAMSR